ncbi:MAG TPA: hypothetical protein VIL00_01230 [Pseudonocardiaceae bacterium]
MAAGLAMLVLALAAVVMVLVVPSDDGTGTVEEESTRNPVERSSGLTPRHG